MLHTGCFNDAAHCSMLLTCHECHFGEKYVCTDENAQEVQLYLNMVIHCKYNVICLVSDIMDIPENIKFCKSLQTVDFSSNPLSR